MICLNTTAKSKYLTKYLLHHHQPCPPVDPRHSGDSGLRSQHAGNHSAWDIVAAQPVFKRQGGSAPPRPGAGEATKVQGGNRRGSRKSPGRWKLLANAQHRGSPSPWVTGGELPPPRQGSPASGGTGGYRAGPRVPPGLSETAAARDDDLRDVLVVRV